MTWTREGPDAVDDAGAPAPQERGARGASRRLQRLVDCRLELAVELHSLRVGKRQDLGHDQAGDLLGRIEPVVRVVETAPAERAGAAAVGPGLEIHHVAEANGRDRKSTRLNSSHANSSYAVFCLKKKKTFR